MAKAKDKYDDVEFVRDEVTQIYEAGRGNLADVLYRELIVNALKCKRDTLDILDLKVLSRAMAEFRYAARVFRPYRTIRKVSIFGSARTPEDDPYFKYAVEFARLLAEEEFMAITGAAEGIMKAGNVGAGAERSFGVNILLPFEQAANVIIGDDPKLVTFKCFFIRKIFFLMEAHAVALFPGGFGTHDEGFETLTLIQTGKTPPMPFLLMEIPGQDYWHNYDKFIREQLLGRSLISPEDLSLYKIIESPEEGVACIKSYYSTYHSIRHVRGKLVIRLEHALAGGGDKARVYAIVRDLVMKADPVPVRVEKEDLLGAFACFWPVKLGLGWDTRLMFPLVRGRGARRTVRRGDNVRNGRRRLNMRVRGRVAALDEVRG
jgi:hypothetical protein